MILLTMLAVLATAVICALGFRIRGGLWGDIISQHIHWGATTARLVAWATPTAILSMLWYQLAWSYFPILIVAAWLGCLLPWWGTIDMGRNQGTWFRDFVVITFRGALWTLPMAAVFAYTGLTAVAVALFVVGLAMGVWYEAGWRTPSTVPGFSQGSELGELYFGFAYGLTLALMAVL